jgi:hypothetical protein
MLTHSLLRRTGELVCAFVFILSYLSSRGEWSGSSISPNIRKLSSQPLTRLGDCGHCSLLASDNVVAQFPEVGLVLLIQSFERTSGPGL